MKRIFRLTAIIAFLFISITTVQAQRRNARYNEYIKQYAPLAVEQMQRHKIPASITLAQGLLESGAGYSELARKSNNHFGIKCGGNWRGRTVRVPLSVPQKRLNRFSDRCPSIFIVAR